MYIYKTKNEYTPTLFDECLDFSKKLSAENTVYKYTRNVQEVARFAVPIVTTCSMPLSLFVRAARQSIGGDFLRSSQGFQNLVLLETEWGFPVTGKVSSLAKPKKKKSWPCKGNPRQ